MDYYEPLFHGFTGRREALASVTRFNNPLYKIECMYYRNTLADHGPMVALVVAELLPYAERAFPEEFNHQAQLRALTQALVHDDPEPFTRSKDLPTPLKIRADRQQLRLWEHEEEEAIELLASQWPETVNGFTYKAMLLSAMNKDTVLAQFVAYCDKIVGFGEALHETFAGNAGFLNPDGTSPTANYHRVVTDIVLGKGYHHGWKKLPPLFDQQSQQHPFLTTPEPLNIPVVVHAPTSQPHTEQSVRQPTGYPFYDKYREVMLERGGQQGLELLVTQREFPSLDSSSSQK